MKMRTIAAVFTMAVLMATLAVPAGATLLTIGTATYAGNSYNLIYDNNPSGPVVWLDYTNPGNTWTNQVAWANSLNTAGTLTYNFLPSFSMNWGSSSWSLPTTVDNNSSVGFPPAATSSQMAYLYYTQLGDTAGSGLVKTDQFTHLQNFLYWSGTELSASPGNAWGFSTFGGGQNFFIENFFFLDGLADRPGQLETAPVPEPSTMLLLCVGLAGVGFIRRKIRR